MTRLRIVLAAQLLLFAAWGGWLLSSRGTVAPEFYLETVPVDPRDFLSGTFVALTYKISAPEPCRRVMGSRSFAQVYVKLEEGMFSAPTPAGPVKLYEATDCAEYPGDGVWVRASVQGGGAGPLRALYGIERFYLNENDPRKNAGSGSVVAKVKQGRRNALVLLDLVQKL